MQRDATSQAVSRNVWRIRTGKNLGLRGLAARLAEVGRPLGHSAVDQIEKGTRRVDVDDLMALSAALGVSPTTLLMPSIPGATEDDGSQLVDATEMVEVPGEGGEVGRVSAGTLWLWLRAEAPLPNYKGSHRKFFVDARPEWDPGAGDPKLWSK
ncbi:hypothetical protein BMG05_19795 [Mycobacterium malmoense]|nr:hypothetical protein BMG05_19795 [Mycobacterium malmoense]